MGLIEFQNYGIKIADANDNKRYDSGEVITAFGKEAAPDNIDVKRLLSGLGWTTLEGNNLEEAAVFTQSLAAAEMGVLNFLDDLPKHLDRASSAADKMGEATRAVYEKRLLGLFETCKGRIRYEARSGYSDANTVRFVKQHLDFLHNHIEKRIGEHGRFVTRGERIDMFKAAFQRDVEWMIPSIVQRAQQGQPEKARAELRKLMDNAYVLQDEYIEMKFIRSLIPMAKEMRLERFINDMEYAWKNMDNKYSDKPADVESRYSDLF